MAFNFLSGQQFGQSPSMQQGNPAFMQASPQLQQILQAAKQPVPGANVAQWAQNPMQASQPPIGQMAGMQTMPGYGQNPLSNQGANGFSLGDYLQRAQASGLNMNQTMSGLQMMLKGWGSHS